MFTKRLYIALLVSLCSSFAWSQSDQAFVYWQKSVGAQGEDVLNDMVKDDDDNFYVVGSTQTAGSQSMDILVSKYSNGGRELWTRTIGELGDDRGVAVEFQNNTLYVLASSTSKTGIFSANVGREDLYLIQMNPSGTITSNTHFGGNKADLPTDLAIAANGDVLISLHSTSTEGDFDLNKGQSDMWVMRTAAHGDLLWKYNYGGSDEDFTTKIAELPTGEIVFSGHSSSFDGDMMLNYGDFDLSLFKLNANGAILWEQNYGGLQAEISVDLLIDESEHIFLTGNTQSLSFDISKNAGFSDAWVLEIDPANGSILWEETHGSEYSDYASALSLNEAGELFLVGTTNAPVFYGEVSAGNKDTWLARIDSPESIEHLTLFGGEGYESISKFSLEADGSMIVVGSSNSQENLFSDNNGMSDGWLFRFDTKAFNNHSEDAVSAHPNPSTGIVYLNHLSTKDEVVVIDLSGNIVIEAFVPTAFSKVLDLTHVSPGVYLVQIQRAEGSELIRLVKN